MRVMRVRLRGGSVRGVFVPRADADVTFLLTSGGYNAGIVADPRRSDRGYQVATRRHAEPYVDPDTWAARAPRKSGSWWAEWAAWLAERSSGMEAPPARQEALAAAPGQYLLLH